MALYRQRRKLAAQQAMTTVPGMPTPIGPTPRQVLSPGQVIPGGYLTSTQWKFSVSCMTTNVASLQGYGDLAKAQAEAKALMDSKSCGTKPKLLHVSRLGAPGEKMAGQWKSCSPCTINRMAELEASMK